jgi:hypothetical protein
MAMEKFRAPPLPVPPKVYDQLYMTQIVRVLGLYFSQLDSQTPNQANSYRALQFIGGDFTGGDVTADSVTASTFTGGSMDAEYGDFTNLVANLMTSGSFQGGNAVFGNMTAAQANASLFTGSGREINFPHGAFSSTLNQADGNIATAYAMTYDTTDYSYGVSIGSHTTTFTASIATTTMTVTANSAGSILPGMIITGTGVSANTYIVTQLTGTPGGTGTYTVSVSQTVSSTTITGTRASKLVVTYPGRYNLQFSAQFVNTDSQIHDIDVWFRKNGVLSSAADIAHSNSQFSVPNKHGSIDGHLIGALNFFIDLAANDYIEIMWHTYNTACTIQALPAVSASGTTPAIPATPSIIATVAYVSAPVAALTRVTPVGVAGAGEVGTPVIAVVTP